MLRVAVVALMFVLVSAASVMAEEPTMDMWAQLETSAYQLYQREQGGLRAVCSAGAYWSDGERTRLLTAGHCVTNTRVDYTVTQDGLTFTEAKVLAVGYEWDALGRRYTQDGHDWAVLEIQKGSTYMPVAEDPQLVIGSRLFLVGYPLAGDKFGAAGIVANPNYRVIGTEWDRGIAANIFALPGSSGTPVVDVTGRIVGIVVAGARQGDNLTILTPVTMVEFPPLEEDDA